MHPLILGGLELRDPSELLAVCVSHATAGRMPQEEPVYPVGAPRPATGALAAKRIALHDKLGHICVGMRRLIVRSRLASDEVELLDALAHDRGLTRSATIRLDHPRARAGGPARLVGAVPADR